MAATYTAARCRAIFGQEMIPCPKCGSYNIGWQTPIRMPDAIVKGDDARTVLRKYARAVKDGHTPLKGPVFLWCQDCLHKGPAMDCSGRTSEEVGQDRAVAAEVKRLWNSQLDLHSCTPPFEQEYLGMPAPPEGTKLRDAARHRRHDEKTRPKKTSNG
jgi:hypothetical protein